METDSIFTQQNKSIRLERKDIKRRNTLDIWMEEHNKLPTTVIRVEKEIEESHETKGLGGIGKQNFFLL